MDDRDFLMPIASAMAAVVLLFMLFTGVIFRNHERRLERLERSTAIKSLDLTERAAEAYHALRNMCYLIAMNEAKDPVEACDE